MSRSTGRYYRAATKVCLVAFWYVVSFFGIVLNKTILSPGETSQVGPLALALVQMLSTVIFGKLREIITSPVGSSAEVDWATMRTSLLGLGVLRFLVTVLGLISLRYVAASFTETVKASSPIFTVVAAWILTSERTPPSVLMSLIPVMLGLFAATVGEHSFTLVGFAAAVLVNLTECVQNVFCSKLMQPDSNGNARFSSGQLQYCSACASLVIQIPFFAYAFWQGSLDLPSGAIHWAWLFIAGCVYFLQSALAFEIMSCYSPVTMSVMNTAKRALIICLCTSYFGNIITRTALIGTVVTLMGSGLYSYRKSQLRKLADGPEIDNNSKKQEDAKGSGANNAIATRSTQVCLPRSCLAGGWWRSKRLFAGQWQFKRGVNLPPGAKLLLYGCIITSISRCSSLGAPASVKDCNNHPAPVAFCAPCRREGHIRKISDVRATHDKPLRQDRRQRRNGDCARRGY
mmetsp:Transcript_1383/g.3544  ORF Transcript_1383/g.3544 Transcript_1383/m.3544 type:complete len:459 (-) Transcript_1383:60-1436(-)